MSLGAIDFGIIVDGAVIMTENIIRRLGMRQRRAGRILTFGERMETVMEGGRQVARPTVFGMAIIMIVLVSILALTGIEGKMFKPMAIVLLLVLTGALILTLSLVLALCAILLGGKIAERENRLNRWLVGAYRPVLHWALQWRWATVVGAIALLAITAWMATALGSVFVSKLGEGALTVQPARIPSIALTTSVEMQKELERKLKDAFPDEIAMIFARTGTAEVATDPMGPNVSDTYLMLTPRSQWTKAHTQEELA